MSEMGFDEINPGTKVSNLSVAYQQVVEICKSISRNAKVLILDEPTAVLTVKEIQKLFTLLKKLKADGVSIIYISHRLEEIFELCDTITVMKDGAFVDCIPAGSIDKDGLIRKMVGRELNQMFPKRNAEIGDTILEVEHLTGSELVQDISFSVKAGQVLGFYGLVGAGKQRQCVPFSVQINGSLEISGSWENRSTLSHRNRQSGQNWECCLKTGSARVFFWNRALK